VISDIARRLGAYEPRLVDHAHSRAAVAVLLRDRGERVDVLFIKRAEFEGDPWSGHMAFPGGRMEAHDPEASDAAIRETREEVGLSLSGAVNLGRLDDLQGRGDASGLVVSAHVYQLGEPEALRPNHEVAEAFWFPLHELHSPDRQVEYEHPLVEQSYPGIVVGNPERHVVWGLTYRFLEDFHRIVGRPLPMRWHFDPDSQMKLVER
jgi:ADP-ribose pyrophosphatase YjhB (NUDIX family)